MNRTKEPRPEGAIRYGKCPGCEEMAWLFKWEGDEPMCEGCIDEAHDAYHEAMDAMAGDHEDVEDLDVDTGEEWGEEGEEYY